MSRRLDIEITSLSDERFTWRVSGAKQPKGEAAASLLPEGTKIGDELKADADFTIDGIDVLAIATPKRERKEPQRLELIAKDPTDLVTTKLAAKGGGGRRDRDERGGGRRRDRDGRGARREGGRDGEGPRGRGRGDRPHRPAPPEVPTRPKAKRLRAGKTHRNAVLAALPDEQRPVADQLVAGGLPAVRTAIKEQNETNKAEGRPEVKPGPLIGLAEQLQEQLRTAEWRDRAEAAVAQADEVDLRDLRSVVVAGDTAANDEETRALAGQLRDALNSRVETEQAAWAEEISALIQAGRVIRALRVSSRSPKAGAPLPGDLATRLATAVVDSVDENMTDDRWGALLDALAFSPVRALVELDHIPEKPSEELLNTLRAVAARLPELARKFGVDPSTAPKNPPRRRRPGGDKPKKGPRDGGGRGDQPKGGRPTGDQPKGGQPKRDASKGAKPAPATGETATAPEPTPKDGPEAAPEAATTEMSTPSETAAAASEAAASEAAAPEAATPEAPTSEAPASEPSAADSPTEDTAGDPSPAPDTAANE